MRLALVFILIALCCWSAYSNTFENPFIWDDDGIVVRNPLIKDRRFLPKIFTSDLYFGAVAGSNFYRPIQAISYLWDYSFWRLRPAGYHITNLSLHILASFLVFIFIYQFFNNYLASFTAAMLFALCPLHTEAVTYVSGRADLLLAVFLISSFLFFKKSNSSPRARKAIYLILSLALFSLGLLSKELAVVFPLAILAYTYFFAKDSLKKRYYFLKMTFPFFLISLAYIMLRVSVLRFVTLRPQELTQAPLFLRIIILPKVILAYIRLLIFPVNLHMSRTLVRPTTTPGILLSSAMLALIIFICIYVFKKGTKNARFMFFWALVFLLPQSGLFAINAPLAEHFVYLSSVSFFSALSYLFFKRLSRPLFFFTASGLIVYYGLLTYSRNIEWRNPRIFFERIVKFSPHSFQAHNNLGLEYERGNEFDRAISEYKRALEIRPGLLEAHLNLSGLYYKIGKFSDAELEYKTVERLIPANKAAEVQNNIGVLYEGWGFPDKALARYELALRLGPGLNFIHFNIARVYFKNSKLNKAAEGILKSFSQAGVSGDKDIFGAKIINEICLKYIQANPGNFNYAPFFYNNLGVEFARQGFLDTALNVFMMAIAFEPEYADAHFNLGLVYLNKGLKTQAVREFKSALKINPAHAQAKGLSRRHKAAAF